MSNKFKSFFLRNKHVHKLGITGDILSVSILLTVLVKLALALSVTWIVLSVLSALAVSWIGFWLYQGYKVRNSFSRCQYIPVHRSECCCGCDEDYEEDEED